MCVGAQLHHMTHVGLPGRVNEGRQPGALNWGLYPEDDFRAVNRDPVSVSFPYYLHTLLFFLLSLLSCPLWKALLSL